MIYQKIQNNFSYILNKKTSKSIRIFIYLLLINLIAFLLIAYKFEYYNYKHYLGYIKKDDKFYTYVYVLEEDVSKIIKSKLCNDLNFKIISIGDSYIVDNKKTVLFKIDIDLDYMNMIENNIVDLNFKLDKTTLVKELRKEIDKWKN